MLAVVFWGSHERWIWKQWQTLWYGLVRLQRGRKLEQKDLVKESSSRVGPPLYSIKDECLKKYKLGRAWWRGNRPGEAIWRLMTIPFWKRSGVCQNRWQLVKKIKRRYYCFQHHFRLVSPPPHQTQTNTHTHCPRWPPTVSSHLIPKILNPVSHLLFFSDSKTARISLNVLHQPSQCFTLVQSIPKQFQMSFFLFVLEFIDFMQN